MWDYEEKKFNLFGNHLDYSYYDNSSYFIYTQLYSS